MLSTKTAEKCKKRTVCFCLNRRQALKGHEAIVEEAVVEEAVVEEAVAEQAAVEEAVVVEGV